MNARGRGTRALLAVGVLVAALATAGPGLAHPLLPEGDGPALPQSTPIQPSQPAPVAHPVQEAHESTWTPPLVGASIGIAVALLALAFRWGRRPVPPRQPQPTRF